MSEATQRRLAAIVSADVVGYSRLMGADEAGTHARLKARFEDLVLPKIAEYGGRVVKLMGDGLLAEFPSVIDAVNWAVDAQTRTAERVAEEQGLPTINYRVGVNLGDIIVDGDDIFGDGVNIAARLQEMADPGGVCISEKVHEEVRGKLDISFTDGGIQTAKNIANPIHIWAWSPQVSGNLAGEHEDDAAPQNLVLDNPSIAVLPFANMSGDEEQEYFTDGITEDIITTLSKVPRLFVVSRNSTFVYKGQAVNIRSVAAEQGVRYVLEGSVRKSGNRVRITAQLIDATKDLHIWADHYDGNLEDVFTLQDEITQEIVGALEVNLSEGEQARLWRKRAGDPRVYDHTLRGRAYYQQFTRRTNLQARAEYEAAIRLNPEFAIAYVFLGYTYGDEARWGWADDPETSLSKKAELVEKVLALDPDLAEGHASNGYLHLLLRQHDEAVTAIHTALSLGPSNSDVHHVAAMVFNYSGLPDQGMSVAKQAIRLSPMAYSNALTELGHAHCLMGQYKEATTVLKRALHLAPFWRSARALLVLALHESGLSEQAEAEAQEILRAAPHFSVGNWVNCHPYRRKEDVEDYTNALRLAGLPA